MAIVFVVGVLSGIAAVGIFIKMASSTLPQESFWAKYGTTIGLGCFLLACVCGLVFGALTRSYCEKPSEERLQWVSNLACPVEKDPAGFPSQIRLHDVGSLRDVS